MAFIAALQRLFRDYEVLLDNYTSLSAVSSKSKQKDSEMTSTQFFAPTVAPVASKPLGQTSYGCKDNNMCVLLQESASVDENTFSNEIACIEARCLTQEQRDYWNNVKNLIFNNNYTRRTANQHSEKIQKNKNRIKIIDYLYLGKANDTGFIDNYNDIPTKNDTFCVGCAKARKAAKFCSQDSILMDIGPDDFKSSDGQINFVNWAVGAIEKINKHISNKENVSVYCQQGKDRSPAFVATYLFVMTNIPVTEASENKVYDFLESKRYEVDQYTIDAEKLSYFNGRMRNLIPMIKLRLFSTILSENNKNLIEKQCLYYNEVMVADEFENWLGLNFYFPTIKENSEEYNPDYIIFDNSNNPQEVTALLNTCDLDNWCNVINKLTGELDTAKNIPTNGGWNTSVLPENNQIKVRNFIEYFLEKKGKATIDNNPQFASFKTALQNLARTNRLFSNLKQIKIIYSEFTEANKTGDFSWMIDKPEYSRSLFVFNDNEKHFYEFFNNKIIGNPGDGNAIIRPYQGRDPPRAIGVPTGTLEKGGYKQLIDSTKKPIDDSMKTFLKLLETENYDSVIISWDFKKNTLGVGLFNPSNQIKDYIVKQIQNTVASANNKL
jgi:hypothetical protein